MTTTRLEQRTLWAIAAAAAALLLWLPLLAGFEAGKATPAAEILGWQALDAAELLGLAATVWAGLRHRAALAPVALVTALLFVLDAVVDTATSAETPDSLAVAVAMALCAELPLAAALTWLASRALPPRLPAPVRVRAR